MTKPFIKWAGGKTRSLPEILKAIPGKVRDFDSYAEPFLGGGAVFFELESEIDKAFLSDRNPELMNTYRIVRNDPTSLIAALLRHENEHSPIHYNKVRGNDPIGLSDTEAAARFIYLNKTCYNGLYRVNHRGGFNVPMGSNKNPKICDHEKIRAASDALRRVALLTESFEDFIPRENSLVYCDPPYPESFTGYTTQKFTEEDHRKLFSKIVLWMESGAVVILSNKNLPFVRELYRDFRIIEVTGSQNINCRTDRRGPVKELIIRGH